MCNIIHIVNHLVALLHPWCTCTLVSRFSIKIKYNFQVVEMLHTSFIYFSFSTAFSFMSRLYILLLFIPSLPLPLSLPLSLSGFLDVIYSLSCYSLISKTFLVRDESIYKLRVKTLLHKLWIHIVFTCSKCQIE